jgi:precorrin-6B methylase 2
MSNDTAYYIDWLAERYHFDAAARHPLIEEKFLHALPPNDTIALIDVGAGTGANCRYLMEKIPANQEWILIEQNSEFSEESLRSLQHHGLQKGYETYLQNGTLTLKAPAKTVQIKALQGSLLEINRMADLSATNAVVANAVFDLFTAEEFETFVQKITRHQLLFYATMNYENMHFLPTHPQDEKMICLYHEHMLRPQDMGTALGPGSVVQMIEILQQHRYAVTAGNSLWHIHSKHEKMMRYLLNFMASAIAELPLSVEDTLLLKPWKKQKEEATVLHLIIEHQDILGRFM